MFTDSSTTNQITDTFQPPPPPPPNKNQTSVFFTLKEPCLKKDSQNPSFEYLKLKDGKKLTFYSNVKINLSFEFPPHHTKMNYKIHLEFENNELKSKHFKMETHSTDFHPSIEREGLFTSPYGISFFFENIGSFKNSLKLVVSMKSVCMNGKEHIFKFYSEEFCVKSKYNKKRSTGSDSPPSKLELKPFPLNEIIHTFEDLNFKRKLYNESPYHPHKKLKTLGEPFAPKFNLTAIGTTIPIPELDEEKIESLKYIQTNTDDRTLPLDIGPLISLSSSFEEEKEKENFEMIFNDDFDESPRFLLDADLS
jgi:hypothetical protein